MRRYATRAPLSATSSSELLADCNRVGHADIATIVRELRDCDEGSRQSFQFSFATKLAHMVDPRVPVYDSFIAAFYFYVPPSSGRPFEERLRSLLTFHTFLRGEYNRVIRDGLLEAAVEGFRAHFGIRGAICDERIVDWLLWGWVSLLHTGPSSAVRRSTSRPASSV